jgi:predicted flap endonuclease-1-like 5' DNA nuclease
MSALTLSIFIALLVGASAASWKGSMVWNNRTRDARNEDPRDQEVRELSAALSIARKELSKTTAAHEGTMSQSSELHVRLQRAESQLTDTQQKYSVTKETLNKEIEQREALLEEQRLLQQELERARVRITELEIQAKVASQSSELVAGLDILDEDDHETEQLRAQVQQLESDAARWKQHCVVITRTNKLLRAQLEELNRKSATAADSETAATAAAQPRDPALQRDELQSIRGIGEKVEQKLNLLGIFSFRQLVELEPAVFERAKLVLPGLEQRLERDAWQAQARALHLEKYSEVI